MCTIAAGTHPFAVESGPCTVTDGCFRSPNYPNRYNWREACTISVLDYVVLRVDAFDTLTSDFGGDAAELEVNGVFFSGDEGPEGVMVNEGTSITWTSHQSFSSNNVVVYTGFEICGVRVVTLSPTSTRTPTHSPTSTRTPTATRSPTGSQLFAVESGPCTVTDGCFQSPDYPDNYGVDRACTFSVLQDNVVLRVDAFETESGYDELEVNEVSFSGSEGPQGEIVNVGTPISFSSDGSIDYMGFEICGERATPTSSPTISPTYSPTTTRSPTISPTGARM